MNRIIILILALTAHLSAYCQSSKTEFTAPKLYPEGIAFDSRTDKAYIGSVKTGTIGSVDEAGQYKEFYVDASLKSTYGMKVDEKRNRLWVCSGDANYSKYKDASTFKRIARVIAIDLTTAKKIVDVDLSSLYSGSHFPNDLTIDNKGNIYITDSFSPAIYKIDDKGNASLFATNDLFKSSFVGLNGITYHPKGYLLVAHNTDGVILKVDLKDPSIVSKVELNQLFPGADGLWLDGNSLVVVQNKGVNRLFKLTSNDSWKTASIESRTTPDELLKYPTTCGAFKGGIAVLNARLNEINDSTYKPADKFSFQIVEFSAAR